MDGVTIGQYRVTGTIGRGGMGAVYAAEHTLLGRPAAIKVLLPELSQKQDVVTRFFNEARAATAIRHPGIIEIYDFGWTEDGAAFIVMEHLQGETLARRAARARLRWPAALAIARQIAGALSAAHAKGIVHRDLKPDNVFLVPDPEVPGGERIKLLDFGIAKLAAETSNTPNVTRTGSVLGTPTYMAPEQCRGVAVDHRADLYALGCVIYELCCGRPPYVGEGTGDVLAAHIHLPVPAMQGAVSPLPPAVEQLVHRLLAKRPGDRVQSAEALIGAIDALPVERAASTIGPRGSVPIASSPSLTTLSGSASTSMRMPRARRARWPVAVFSLAMAAISAGAVVLVMRGGDDRAAGAPPTQQAAAPQPQVPSSQSAAASSQPPPSSDSVQPKQASEPVPSPPSSSDSVQPKQPSEPAPSPQPPSDTAPSKQPSEPVPSQQPPSGTAPPSPPTQAPMPPAAGTTDRPAEPATVDVAIDSVPSGAQVLLGGAVLGTTPFRGTLPRGNRDVKLVVRLGGYTERTVVVRASRPINERIKLVKIAPPTPPTPPTPPAQRTKANRDQSVNPF